MHRSEGLFWLSINHLLYDQNHSLLVLWVAVCVVYAAFPNKAISIEFGDGTSELTPSDAPDPLLKANWNSVVGQSGTVGALNDSTGVATTASITWTSAVAVGLAGFAPNTANSATNLLYSNAIGSDPTVQIIIINITGIPYSQFEVLTFAFGGTTATNTLSMTIFNVTKYWASGGVASVDATTLIEATSEDPANPTIGPLQYQRFPFLTVPSVNIVAGGAIHNIIANAVVGVQIYDTGSTTGGSTTTTTSTGKSTTTKGKTTTSTASRLSSFWWR